MSLSKLFNTQVCAGNLWTAAEPTLYNKIACCYNTSTHIINACK